MSIPDYPTRETLQVLERLPSGGYAWLKPEDDEPRYVLTDAGRRALRMAELFGTDDVA